MEMIEGRTNEAPAPVGPYSQSARIGSLVAAAGQGGFDRNGELVAGGVAEQTSQTLANVEAVLRANGASLRNAIRIGVFLTEVEDFAEMNRVYGETLAEPFPARTTVYVGLPDGMRVEIDALAVIPG
jgi:2-iminobutanoate/2-iminopropanoate deaminase